MRYEFTREVPAARRAFFEKLLYEHELKKKSAKVIIRRGVGSFVHPVTKVSHEEYYICTFMKARTTLGIDRIVIIDDTNHEAFVKHRRQV